MLIEAGVRKKVRALASIVEEWDCHCGPQSPATTSAEDPDGTGNLESPLYLTCIQNCIMPENFLEPCLVRSLTCSKVPC